MKKALVLLFVICSGLAVFGQEQWQVHGSVQYGFVVPHNSLMEPLISGHSVGGSVRVVKRVSNRLYSRPYGNPYQGVDFTYINTGKQRFRITAATVTFSSTDLLRDNSHMVPAT